MALAAGGYPPVPCRSEKNAQITRLRNQAVPVEVTVSGCIGLMGGSGSNVAGYACRGEFTLAGHRYREAIPGTRSLSRNENPSGRSAAGPGTRVNTPVLLLEPEQASEKVFLLPAVLLALLGVFVAALALKRENLRRASGPIP